MPIPGETALIVAGGLAAAGHLSLPAVIAVAAAAAILGDNLGYWIGRTGGRPLLVRDGRGARHRRALVARADRFFDRYGVGAVVAGRWIAGLRYLAALFAGATRMPYRRFFVANALGGVAWAASVATVALVLGPHGSFLLVAASLTVAVTAFVASRLRGRRGAAPA